MTPAAVRCHACQRRRSYPFPFWFLSVKNSAWLWLAFGAVLGVSAGARYWNAATRQAVAVTNSSAGNAGAADDSSGAAKGREAAEQVARRLVDSGWPSDAAAEVAELNADFLAVLAEEDPGRVDRIAQTLSRLGGRPGLMDLVRRHPESTLR